MPLTYVTPLIRSKVSSLPFRPLLPSLWTLCRGSDHGPGYSRPGWKNPPTLRSLFAGYAKYIFAALYSRTMVTPFRREPKSRHALLN
jgi:hypothetical protein